jgi:hypothetical protein
MSVQGLFIDWYIRGKNFLYFTFYISIIRVCQTRIYCCMNVETLYCFLIASC